ncbi:MAG: PAS domain S-box protein, partial [Anaerolineales bacterium]
MTSKAKPRSRRRARAVGPQPSPVHEERFRALIEDSSEALVLVDRQGAATYVSPSVQRIYGFSPEELIGTG